MKTSSNFTIAVHTMIVIAHFSPKSKVTSDFIAASVGVNPVVIRRTLSDLKAAGLVQTQAGAGGATLAARPSSITLLDIYNAVIKDEGSVFSFHENSNPACPVGKKIHKILDEHLDAAQSAFEKKLGAVSLDMLAKKV